MLLEVFRANIRYVIVPRIVAHEHYLSYDFTGMLQCERHVWKDAVTIAQVRYAHPRTPEAYLEVLQGLGIRAALSRTDACRMLRAEYDSKPMLRRLK